MEVECQHGVNDRPDGTDSARSKSHALSQQTAVAGWVVEGGGETRTSLARASASCAARPLVAACVAARPLVACRQIQAIGQQINQTSARTSVNGLCVLQIGECSHTLEG